LGHENCEEAAEHGLGLKQPFPPDVVVVPKWVGYWADKAAEARQGAGSPKGLIPCASKKHKSCKSTSNNRAEEAEKAATKAESEKKYKRKYETLKDEHETLKIENETLKDKYKTLKGKYKTLKKHKSV